MKKGTLVRIRKGLFSNRCHVNVCLTNEALQSDSIIGSTMFGLLNDDISSHFNVEHMPAGLKGMVIKTSNFSNTIMSMVLFENSKVGWIFSELLEVLQCPESIPA